MWALMTALVTPEFFFFARVSKSQSGQSNRRSVISSVNTTKAAHRSQMEGSLGLGGVRRFREHRGEWPHSGHCHNGAPCDGTVRK